MTPQVSGNFGMPYFPGVVRGVLRRGSEGATPGNIVLTASSGIQQLTARPAGFLIIEGAPFSHAMIALLDIGAPTVIVCEQQASALIEGAMLMVDGCTGRISTDDADHDFPIQQSLRHELPSLLTGQPVLTADGAPVSLCASVRSAGAARLAVEDGARSIGLVRTEFLVPEENRVPDTLFYQNVFDTVCQAATPLPVTFRLLDLAEDKMPGWMPQSALSSGALGLQGVRLYAAAPVRRVVQAQLSAINALPEQYNIRVLIPYLVRHEELHYWREWVSEQVPGNMEIGAMAETPAGVLDIANWFDHADVVAIGCNDLMQCLFAADRDRPALRDYLDAYAPYLYRLFRQIADSVRGNLNKVTLCGVLPQLPGVLPLLLGLGYRMFSVDAHSIPYLAKTVTSVTLAEAEQTLANVCEANESREVREILRLPAQMRCPFIF
ncbi:MAG: phosphoenolpyruvate-protein phosphotransferase [Gammaproteobacteria bacterium]|nr:phosphoenolpyruvate-protein phosphotransferase [Gammaproteobacteria bacterium]